MFSANGTLISASAAPHCRIGKEDEITLDGSGFFLTARILREGSAISDDSKYTNLQISSPPLSSSPHIPSSLLTVSENPDNQLTQHKSTKPNWARFSLSTVLNFQQHEQQRFPDQLTLSFLSKLLSQPAPFRRVSVLETRLDQVQVPSLCPVVRGPIPARVTQGEKEFLCVCVGISRA